MACSPLATKYWPVSSAREAEGVQLARPPPAARRCRTRMQRARFCPSSGGLMMTGGEMPSARTATSVSP